MVNGKVVTALDDSAVLLLDSKWGTGKTTFVKMWLGELTKIGIPNIYFDAFANDYHEDAFLTIAGEIIARSEQLRPKSTRAINAFKTKAIGVAKALGRSSIPSFYTTENIPLNDLHPDTVSAKRAMRGDSLCSGMVGINS